MHSQISPKFTAEKLGPQCTLDDRIDVFEDWMNGWTLQHAWALCDAKYVQRQDGGFAVLTLCTTYFEPIECYLSGEASHGQSKKFFRRGFLRVFSKLPGTLAANGFASPELPGQIADEIYVQLRCGLFHEGGTKHKLVIRSDTAPLGFMLEATTGAIGSIVIDPLKFLAEIQAHLNTYVTSLRTPSNEELRTNFERFFHQRLSGAGFVPPPALTPS